jgi:hypothetical protein
MIVEIIIYLTFLGLAINSFIKNQNTFGFVCLLFLVSGLAYVPYTFQGSYQEVIDIYSMDRGINLEGNFILGGGVISANPVYYVYVQTSDGGYKLKTIKDAVVYMDDTELPSLKYIRKCDSEPSAFNWVDFECETKTKIVVPTGTIVSFFEG